MDNQPHEQGPPMGDHPPTNDGQGLPPQESSYPNGDGGGVIGSAAIRPVFLGNLKTNFIPICLFAIIGVMISVAGIGFGLNAIATK